MPHPAAPRQRMNRKAIIVVMTLGVFAVLGTLMVLFFDGVPPWPILAWFAASHAFFCAVVMLAKPFNGPYRPPLDDLPPRRDDER